MFCFLKKYLHGLVYCLVGISIACSHHAPRPVGETLNTGKDIQQPAGSTTLLGGFPVGLTPSADGKFAIVCGMGYRESLYSIATGDGHIAGEIKFANLAPTHMSPQTGVDTNTTADPSYARNGLYYGVVAAGNTTYAAQGEHHSISIASLSPEGQLAATGSIQAKPNDFVAGLAADDRGMLYVSNNNDGNDAGFAEPGSVAIYDLKSKAEVGRYVFDNPTHTSNFPLGIVSLHNGSKTYCASERDGCVFVLNTIDPSHPALIKMIATGSHPLGMIFNRDQTRLWVANAQSDTLSLIDTANDAVIGTVLLRPGTSRGLPGVTPAALVLSADEQTVYVTLADMNAIGVVDVQSLTLKGMIPAGWYPTGVAVTTDNRLLVVNAKGTRAHNPNPKNNPLDKKTGKDPYILNVIQGDFESMPIPNTNRLADLTDVVLHDNHIDDQDDRITRNPLADIGLKAGKIKHVIYIIKENRTYDQVLGDDARGNGDPSLAIFGKDVTPNQHALADRFVLLDNCYACGEVSGSGWTWSTQSISNEYVERNIPYNYSGRGRSYDFEGENNGYITGGFPATDPDGKLLSKDPAFKNGAPPIENVASTNVHLWDRAHEAGIPYRNYGCFLSSSNLQGSMPSFYPTVNGLQPPGHDLAGLTDMDFPSFNLDFPDSDAPKICFDQTHDVKCKYLTSAYGKYKAPSRFYEWNREFQMMLARDRSGGAVPALMFVRLPHDHTQGMGSGRHSPASEVADNDFSIGQLVEAVSHSKVWESTAIFIIEDDAQNGPDHVDAHRTTAFVISPWIARGSVDHHFNNTDTLLKTMELLLGLKPMSQYDALAAPILDWGSNPSNADPYTALLPAKDIIAQTNPTLLRTILHGNAKSANDLVAASDKMDFTHPDAAPADELNQIIWKSVRGTDSRMPAPKNSLVSPVRRAPEKADKDDDDD